MTGVCKASATKIVSIKINTVALIAVRRAGYDERNH